MIRPCLLIPIYNHGSTIRAVLDELADLHLPCIVVDDGSDAATREELDVLDAERPWVDIQRFPTNRGRGAALMHGYRLAAKRGFTHAVQVDADGQHAASSIPEFLAEAEAHPADLILGDPIFDSMAPLNRLHGRRVSQWWVWIETLCRDIRDPLCGLRCSPLGATVKLIDRIPMGSGMEFDTEIAVRLFWSGVSMRNVQTPVKYYEYGLSTFRPFKDNLRISWLHTRLFLGALPRMPRLLRRRSKRLDKGTHIR